MDGKNWLNFSKYTTLFAIAVVSLSSGFSLYGQKNSFQSIGFIENKGQIINQNHVENADVMFLYVGKGMNIQLRKTGYSYEFFSANGRSEKVHVSKMLDTPSELLKTTLSVHRIDIDFYGMCDSTTIVASAKTTDHLNYFISGKSISNVGIFQKISYLHVFPNTDIDFFITDNENAPLKYNIILHPGADIKNIKFLVKGMSQFVKIEDGALIYSTPSGEISERIPRSYYLDAGSEMAESWQNVQNPLNEIQEVNFNLENNLISFSGSYDNKKTLVIDPSTNRIWGTYYGDVFGDHCNAVRCDTQNNVYITGYTLNSTNIATNGTYQSTIGGNYDAFIAKFDPNGMRIWGTYYGGNSVETSYSIYISALGYLYICGDTFSTSGIASSGAHQTTYGGGIDDSYLAKFDYNGQLKWSTYYGGSLHDIAVDVTMDNNANVLICGHSESSNNISTIGSYQNFQGGQFDIFIAKFDSTGSRQWGSYFGDANADEAWGITCDNSNDIYVTGFTGSMNNIASVGSHQPIYGGGFQDGCIAKFSSNGSTVLWSTYYGGTGDDAATGIIFVNPGTIIVVGNANSSNNISSVGSFQQTPGSAEDAFISKFDLNGVRQWGTYFGGNNTDYVDDVVVDANSNILFCGSTISTDIISSANAYQTTNTAPNDYDAYFEKFDGNGMRKLGTYYGGSYSDYGHGIALNASGQIYIAGETSSSDSISTSGSFKPTYSSSTDGFLGKFCLAPEPLISPAGTTLICTGEVLNVFTGNGYSSYLWNNFEITSGFLLPASTPAGTYYFNVTVSDSFGCTGTSDSSTVIIDVCAEANALNNYLDVQIFPTPSNENIRIVFSESDQMEKKVELFSSEGKLELSAATFQNSFLLDMNKLSSGIYFLRVRVGQKFFEKKIIKQ